MSDVDPTPVQTNMSGPVFDALVAGVEAFNAAAAAAVPPVPAVEPTVAP